MLTVLAETCSQVSSILVVHPKTRNLHYNLTLAILRLSTQIRKNSTAKKMAKKGQTSGRVTQEEYCFLHTRSSAQRDQQHKGRKDKNAIQQECKRQEMSKKSSSCLHWKGTKVWRSTCVGSWPSSPTTRGSPGVCEGVPGHSRSPAGYSG